MLSVSSTVCSTVMMIKTPKFWVLRFLQTERLWLQSVRMTIRRISIPKNSLTRLPVNRRQLIFGMYSFGTPKLRTVHFNFNFVYLNPPMCDSHEWRTFEMAKQLHSFQGTLTQEECSRRLQTDVKRYLKVTSRDENRYFVTTNTHVIPTWGKFERKRKNWKFCWISFNL